MTKPTYNARARRDLRSILRSSYELFGAMQAKRYSEQLEQAGLDLASGLRTGRVVGEKRPDHRYLRAGSHCLVYRVDGEGRIVVLRILHSRVDFRRHL